MYIKCCLFIFYYITSSLSFSFLGNVINNYKQWIRTVAKMKAAIKRLPAKKMLTACAAKCCSNEDKSWPEVSLETSTSRNVLILENAYKFLYRYYCTLTSLANFIPTNPSTGFVGCFYNSAMTHLCWTCPIVSRFWIWFFFVSHLYSVPL